MEQEKARKPLNDAHLLPLRHSPQSLQSTTTNPKIKYSRASCFPSNSIDLSEIPEISSNPRISLPPTITPGEISSALRHFLKEKCLDQTASQTRSQFSWYYTFQQTLQTSHQMLSGWQAPTVFQRKDYDHAETRRTLRLYLADSFTPPL